MLVRQTIQSKSLPSSINITSTPLSNNFNGWEARNAFSIISLTTDSPTRVRVTGTTIGQNPRISKLFTGLTPSTSYTISFVNRGNNSASDNSFFRVAEITDPALGNGAYLASATYGPTTTGAFTLVFTAPADGMVYFGLVTIGTASAEVDRDSTIALT